MGGGGRFSVGLGVVFGVGIDWVFCALVLRKSGVCGPVYPHS